MFTKISVEKLYLISSIVASIAAIVSLFVACGSLYIGYLSLDAAKITSSNELQYQENSTEADLDMFSDYSNLSVSVQNDGLGPAVISDIRIWYRDQCVESLGSGPNQDRDWEAEYENVMHQFVADLLRSFDVPNPDMWSFSWMITEPGTLIRPGEKRLLFQLYPPKDQALSEFYSKNPVVSERIKKIFGQADRFLSISIGHCSISGKTCDLAGWNPKGFCFKPSRKAE